MILEDNQVVYLNIRVRVFISLEIIIQTRLQLTKKYRIFKSMSIQVKIIKTNTSKYHEKIDTIMHGLC